MKVQRIYTDTSVIGGCFDSEFATWSNGLFIDFRLGHFSPVLSAVVAAEVEDAPGDVQAAYDELLALGAEVLMVTDEALDLADATLPAVCSRRSSTTMRRTSPWQRWRRWTSS